MKRIIDCNPVKGSWFQEHEEYAVSYSQIGWTDILSLIGSRGKIVSSPDPLKGQEARRKTKSNRSRQNEVCSAAVKRSVINFQLDSPVDYVQDLGFDGRKMAEIGKVLCLTERNN